MGKVDEQFVAANLESGHQFWALGIALPSNPHMVLGVQLFERPLQDFFDEVEMKVGPVVEDVPYDQCVLAEPARILVRHNGTEVLAGLQASQDSLSIPSHDWLGKHLV